MDTDWGAILRERLAADAEFREWFGRRPGEAAASLGMPYEVFKGLWPAFAHDDDPD
jgi:hypothetical protein